MKILGTYNKIDFENLDELKTFVANNDGDAYFYNGWTGDVYPVLICDTDNKQEVVIGTDAFDEVREEHLKDIFGYQKVFEN